MAINLQDLERQFSFKEQMKDRFEQVKETTANYLLSEKFPLNNSKVTDYLDKNIKEKNITKKSYTQFLFVLWTITVCLATGGLFLVLTGVLGLEWLSVIFATYILDGMILFGIKGLTE